MCTDIFQHIFHDRLPQEADHDYSTGSRNLELKLGHILYHLRESKSNLKGILGGESGELFMRFLKDYLRDLFSCYLNDFLPMFRKIFCFIIFQVPLRKQLNGG